MPTFATASTPATTATATTAPSTNSPSAPQAAGDTRQDAGADAATANAPAAAGAITLELNAPKELLPLLRNNLDLARLARMPASDALSELELRRVQAATPAQVRSLLETEGYFDPSVVVRRRPGEAVVIEVEVQTGERSRVNKVRLDVQGELERAAFEGDADAKALLEALNAAWSMPVGTPFRNARWSDSKAALLAKLRAEGFAAANWSGTSAQVETAEQGVALTLIVDTGPRYRLGDIRVEGLKLHEAITVRNLAGFKPGAPATESTLLDYQERLIRTGLYDRVAVSLDPDSADPSSTPVIVRLQEALIQQATFGVGISANTGPRVSIEHTHRRVFGQRATARNKFELGRLRQAWEGELSSHAQPELHRNLVGGTFERLEADDNGDIVRSARLRVGRAFETTRREWYSFGQFERADRRTASTYEAISALSLNHHATWRDVDNVVLPTQGVGLSIQSGAGYARSNDSAGPFGRAQARLSYWQPIGSSWFGHARVEVGQVFARSSLAIPETQLFRVGGDDSVRGYAYRSLGPTRNGATAGGRVMAAASVEVARPVSDNLPSVWWATFFDIGQAADSWRELKPVWGAGVGVRWRSPVGPLSVDWAWGDANRKSRLHLSVGITF